jgi:hypothetical protein
MIFEGVQLLSQPRDDRRTEIEMTTWTTGAPVRYRVSTTARQVETMNQEMHSVLDAFERRMTRRLYAVGVAIVLAVTLLWRFWP